LANQVGIDKENALTKDSLANQGAKLEPRDGGLIIGDKIHFEQKIVENLECKRVSDKISSSKVAKLVKRVNKEKKNFFKRIIAGSFKKNMSSVEAGDRERRVKEYLERGYTNFEGARFNGLRDQKEKEDLRAKKATEVLVQEAYPPVHSVAKEEDEMFDTYQIKDISSSSSMNQSEAFGGNEPIDQGDPDQNNSYCSVNNKMHYRFEKKNEFDLESINSKAMLDSRPSPSE
jgi:hypothetical protein